jgi:hypothetical protein
MPPEDIELLSIAPSTLARGKTIAQSTPEFGGGSLGGIFSVALILTVALIPFFAFREIGRVLGADRLKSLIFGASGTNA